MPRRGEVRAEVEERCYTGTEPQVISVASVLRSRDKNKQAQDRVRRLCRRKEVFLECVKAKVSAKRRKVCCVWILESIGQKNRQGARY